MKIWALDEYYKVNPVAGNILELDAKACPEKSVFQLVGARNETVGFQVMVEAAGIGSKTICFNLKKRKVPFIVKAYREWYVKCNENYYADALIPIAGNKTINLKQPDNKIPGQKVQGLYFDIFIPLSIGAGDYDFELSIAIGAKAAKKIAVVLSVIGFSLPSVPTFTVEHNNYSYLSTSRRIVRGKTRLKYLASKTFERELLKGHRLSREHYGCLNIVPYGHRGAFSPTMVPELNKNLKILNFRPWERKFSKFISGKAFIKGYGKGEPVRIFNLPFQLNWPAPFDLYPTHKYTKVMGDAIKAFCSRIRRKNWKKTLFLVTLIHKERRSCYKYNTDEPTRKKDYKLLRNYGGIIKKAQADGNKQVHFRVYVGHFDCNCIMDKCDWQGNEKRCTHSSKLNGVVDLLDCSYDHANAKNIEQQLKTGSQVWVYMTSSWINRPLSDAAQILLNAYSLKAQGFTFADCTFWEGNPWETAGGIMGTCTLFYPGRDIGINALLPSLRLKAARRAIMDIEYLEFLRKTGNPKGGQFLKRFVKHFNVRKISLMDGESTSNMDGESTSKADYKMTGDYGWREFRRDLADEVGKSVNERGEVLCANG